MVSSHSNTTKEKGPVVRLWFRAFRYKSEAAAASAAVRLKTACRLAQPWWKPVADPTESEITCDVWREIFPHLLELSKEASLMLKLAGKSGSANSFDWEMEELA